MIVFEKNDLRISLITPRLLRTEKGIFTDLPTQTVQNREFGDVDYSLSEQSDLITVTTDAACFAISKKNGDVTSVFIEDTSSTVVDFSKGMLPGTARTLDSANGAVKLENGITSLSGASVMDD